MREVSWETELFSSELRGIFTVDDIGVPLELAGEPTRVRALFLDQYATLPVRRGSLANP